MILEELKHKMAIDYYPERIKGETLLEESGFIDCFQIMLAHHNKIKPISNRGYEPNRRGEPYYVSDLHPTITERLNVYQFYAASGYVDKHDASYLKIPDQLFHEVPGVGSIDSKWFERRGPALIIDNVIFHSIRFLQAVEYLEHFGYDKDDIFVFSRDIRRDHPTWQNHCFRGDSNPTLRHLSYYEELLVGLDK